MFHVKHRVTGIKVSMYYYSGLPSVGRSGPYISGVYDGTMYYDMGFIYDILWYWDEGPRR